MDVVGIVIDCADPRAVARFWNEALGWGGVAVTDDGASAVCGPPGAGIRLDCRRVPEAKAGKNRLHLDCNAGELDDLEAEVERLRDLGATIAWEEEFSEEVAAVYRNVVMRDVEGNEFCLGGGHFPP